MNQHFEQIPSILLGITRSTKKLQKIHIIETNGQAECLWAMATSRGLVSTPDDALDAADEAMDLFLELRAACAAVQFLRGEMTWVKEDVDLRLSKVKIGKEKKDLENDAGFYGCG